MLEDNYFKIFSIQNFLIYLLLINIVAFCAMWIDKIKAKNGKWRISEAALFLMAIFGGSIGGIAGMYAFRHKTKKKKFQIGFPAILITQILIFLLYYKF